MEAAISLEMIIGESESELSQTCSLNHAVTMSDSSEQITKRDEWKRSAKQLQSEIYFAYFVCRHPRVRWYSKLLAAVAVGYVMTNAGPDDSINTSDDSANPFFGPGAFTV